MTLDANFRENKSWIKPMEAVRLPERDIKPADVVVHTYSTVGAHKYELARKKGMAHAEAMQSLSEGTDYNTHILPYDSINHPQPKPTYNNRNSFAKKQIAATLLALLPYLSPAMEQAKHNAEKYLTCREYRVEKIEGKETLLGADCKLKENKLGIKPLTYRI